MVYAPGVHQHDVGRSGKVERDATGFQGHQKHSDGWVFCERGYHSIARLHGHAALQPHTLDAHLRPHWRHLAALPVAKDSRSSVYSAVLTPAVKVGVRS